MPSQRAIEALLKLRNERLNESQSDFSLVNQYNLDEENPLTRRIELPTPEERDKDDGISLLQAVGAGLYEFGSTYTFEAPRLAEAIAERALDTDIEISEYFEKAQQESSLAKVLSGVGGAVGYISGLPMRAGITLLGKPATRAAVSLLGKKQIKTQTVGKAVDTAKKYGLENSINPKVVNDVSNAILKQTDDIVTGITKKIDKIDDVFKKSYRNEVESRIQRGVASGLINRKQTNTVRNMVDKVLDGGIPVQNMSQLARVKYGNTSFGRFATEALHDAFIFSTADAVMDGVLQTASIISGEQDEYNFGQTAEAVVGGLLAGTAINAATAGFRPLAKSMKSNKDFRAGMRAIFSKNNYKDKDLVYLSGQIIDFSRKNKFNNGISENFTYKNKDGRTVSINPLDSYTHGVGVARKNLAGRLLDDIGNKKEAREQAIKWLMSNKRDYGKRIIAESTKEGFRNYRDLLPRMAVAGTAMFFTQKGMEYYHTGDFQLDVDDVITNMLIGGYTMRRGNFGRIDIGNDINDLRVGLDALGVKSDQMSVASSYAYRNAREGIGITRDNEELVSYLTNARIISEDDPSVTNQQINAKAGQKSWITEEGRDPYNGFLNEIHGIIGSDFLHVKPLDQWTDTQAREVVKILKNQGIKDSVDLASRYEERILQTTRSMEGHFESTLKKIQLAEFPEIKIESSKEVRGLNEDDVFTLKRGINIDDVLMKKAVNGEFKSWMNGKEGDEARREINELTSSFYSLSDVVSKVNGKAKISNGHYNINSEDTLKGFYNIIRDSERSIDSLTNSKDGRSEFRFSEVDSYVIPMLQNKGKQVSDSVIKIFSKKTIDADEKFQNALINVGLLDETGLKLIESPSQIDYKGTDKVDLTLIHKYLKTINGISGNYEISTDNTIFKTNVDQPAVDGLRYQLTRVGFPKEIKPWIRQIILKNVNTKKLNNSIINEEDVALIFELAGKEATSGAGLISDKDITGFTLKKIIAGDKAFQEKFNNRLDELSEQSGGIVTVIEPEGRLNPYQEEDLKLTVDNIKQGAYAGKGGEVIRDLFVNIQNPKLDSARNKILTYLSEFGAEGQINILNTLKRDGIIKKNVDGNLEVEEKFTVEKITEGALDQLKESFDTIDKRIVRLGFTDDYIKNYIEERSEITRNYVQDATDVLDNKNLTIGLDGFFKKYKIIEEKVSDENLFKTVSHYKDYSNEKDEVKREVLKRLIEEGSKVSKSDLESIRDRIVFRGTEFSNLTTEEKQSVQSDIQQIQFGSMNKVSIPTVSLRNGNLYYGRNKVMQDNKVVKLFHDLGMDFSLFDNNVVYTDPTSPLIIERTINIMSGEGLSDKEKRTIRNETDSLNRSLTKVNLFEDELLQGTHKNKRENEKLYAVHDDNIKERDSLGMMKLDIFDGIDSFIINKRESNKIAKKFIEFYNEHYNKIPDGDGKEEIKRLYNVFEKFQDEPMKLKTKDISHASRFLVTEKLLEGDGNKKLYETYNESSSKELAKVLKRMKLLSRKNFISPSEEYIQSVIDSRNTFDSNKSITNLLESRITDKNGKYRIAIWDDDSSESMSKIIQDLKDEFGDEYPALKEYDLSQTIGTAHSKVSGFDSIGYISRNGMAELHTIMGHDPLSVNPIKPIISSSGKGQAVLYGKTLFMYDPSLDPFLYQNNVDILLTSTAAKITGDLKGQERFIKDKRWNELNDIKDLDEEFIREIGVDAIALRPEKDTYLSSAVESDADFNNMNKAEHQEAYNEIKDELDLNLKMMSEIMDDPYKMNKFMKDALFKGNIPEQAELVSLENLSDMMFFLQQADHANPYDFNPTQVQKFLAKTYIDNVFGNRRALTNRTYTSEEDLNNNKSKYGRYGGQSYIVQTAKGFHGNKKTRLLPTIYDKSNNMVIRGQISLSHNERDTSLNDLPTAKNIRIVQNDRVLTVEEFKNEIKDQYVGLTDSDNKTLEILDDIYKDATLGSLHDNIQNIANLLNTRYEIGILVRRNPRIKPNDIMLLGLKGFLDKRSGLAAEVNSFDVVNVFEGDYDADKIDYFFAHSDYMYDYVNRVGSMFVQGIDPNDLQSEPKFLFSNNSDLAESNISESISSAIAYKRGIGLVQKVPRQINYIENISNKDYMFLDGAQDGEYSEIIRDFDKKQGPSILFKPSENEIVTIDTELLSYVQRFALEAQYIVDGSNKLNPDIVSGNLYEWRDDFLFPDVRNSLSPKQATELQLREIIKQGQTSNGQKVRIFQKFSKDEDGKYTESKTSDVLNNADKLIIREFLNQENKLLNAFSDKKYTGGVERKTSFYDLYMGAKAFKSFHEEGPYKSMSRFLAYKRKSLSKEDNNYLDKILNIKNNAFEPISQTYKDISEKKGGGYLDRIAVQIADSNILDNSKEYFLDQSSYREIEIWFDRLISLDSRRSVSDREISKLKEDSRFEGQSIDTEQIIYDTLPEQERNALFETLKLGELSENVKKDTQKFNNQVANIQRLEKKKKFIQNSKYSGNWKKSKIKPLDYVIKKLTDELIDKYGLYNKTKPKDLKYRKYINIEKNDLKPSVIHFNSMQSLLRQHEYGFRYDSWNDMLRKDSNENKYKDLKTIKDFNSKIYSDETPIGELIPYRDNSIVVNDDMSKFISNNYANAFYAQDIRDRFLARKVQEHGIEFLWAYMEPIRNKNDIGVFHNRPVAIPYKESARYKHGLRFLTKMARGNLDINLKNSENRSNQEWALSRLTEMIDTNETYRQFFDKDVSMMRSFQHNNYAFKLAEFDNNMTSRMNENGDDFSWSNKLLPYNPMLTINKSVLKYYRDYAQSHPESGATIGGESKTTKSNRSEDFMKFIENLNRIEENMVLKDYQNPIRFMHERLKLDKDFRELVKQDLLLEDMPESIKNNPMFTEKSLQKHIPKAVRSDKTILGMAKSLNDVHSTLVKASRQNPMNDSYYEIYRGIGEAIKCK
jgi:hypothetical protein